MLGKIAGAVLGGTIAKQTKGIDGTTGAMLGAAVPLIISRVSLPAMVVIGVGGYFAKKYLDRMDYEPGSSGATDTGSVASIPQPASEPIGTTGSAYSA